MKRRRGLTRRQVAARLGGLLGAALTQPALALEQRATFMPAQLSARAQQSLLLAVANAGERLIAVGGHGVILISEDYGLSWRQARDVPTQATLTGVTFITPDLGFAVGHDAVILKTIDGGEHWTMRYVDTDLGTPLLTVAFSDPKHGLAMGGFGLVLETSDGGWRWRPRALRRGEVDNLSLNKIVSVGGDTYVASDLGRVYYRSSDNSGFMPAQAPSDESLMDLLVLPNAIIVCGTRGEIWRARRDLSGWNELDIAEAKSLTALGLTLDGRIAAAGLGGVLAFAAQDSTTFVKADLNTLSDFAALTAGPRGRLLLFGANGISLVPDRPSA